MSSLEMSSREALPGSTIWKPAQEPVQAPVCGFAGQLGWTLNLGLRDYQETLRWQRSLVDLRRRGMIRDMLIMVEHPAVITVGRQTDKKNLLAGSSDIPVIEVERGGDVTFHGPGQLVSYQVFDLNRRGRDLHAHLRGLEAGVISALASFGVSAHREEGLTGVWVQTAEGVKKISSIGVAAKHWISFHGVAVNLTTNLDSFSTINPCGLTAQTMTSLEALTGKSVSCTEFAARLVDCYAEVFQTSFDRVTLDDLAEDLVSQTGGGHV